jgi:hypothetical protein
MCKQHMDNCEAPGGAVGPRKGYRSSDRLKAAPASAAGLSFVRTTGEPGPGPASPRDSPAAPEQASGHGRFESLRRVLGEVRRSGADTPDASHARAQARPALGLARVQQRQAPAATAEPQGGRHGPRRSGDREGDDTSSVVSETSTVVKTKLRALLQAPLAQPPASAATSPASLGAAGASPSGGGTPRGAPRAFVNAANKQQGRRPLLDVKVYKFRHTPAVALGLASSGAGGALPAGLLGGAAALPPPARSGVMPPVGMTESRRPLDAGVAAAGARHNALTAAGAGCSSVAAPAPHVLACLEVPGPVYSSREDVLNNRDIQVGSVCTW